MQPLRAVPDLALRARRRILRHRRGLAALALAGAVLFGLRAVAPASPATVAVWSASRDLATGAVLDTSELEQRRVDPASVPADRVTEPTQVLGRTLAAPVSRGEVLTIGRTLTAGLLRGYPGRDAVPVRITDADVVGLLRVGDRIDLVAADPDGRREPAVLAQDVPVVAVPRPESGAFDSGAPGRLVVVAVPSALATRVSAAAVSDYVSVLWSGD